LSGEIAICARLADVAEAPLPGSELRTCFDCGAQVVLSPSTVKRAPRFVLCHDCGATLMQANPDLDLGFSEDALRDYLELDRLREAAP